MPLDRQQDVIPPADGNWKNYTPPISAIQSRKHSRASLIHTNSLPALPEDRMRNQNVYTAEISSGVNSDFAATSKPVLTLRATVQREFVVELRNRTNAARSFSSLSARLPALAGFL